MEPRSLQPNGFPEIRQSAAYALPRTGRCRKTATFLERLSLSKFPSQYPVLYGSLLELRSFFHRIQSLARRGDILSLEIGPVYQQRDAQRGLVRNKRTQARKMGIQKPLSDFPWQTGEDCHLFLCGWNAAEEWVGLSFGSAKSNANIQVEESSSAYPDGGNSMPLSAVQQSAKRDGGVLDHAHRNRT